LFKTFPLAVMQRLEKRAHSAPSFCGEAVILQSPNSREAVTAKFKGADAAADSDRKSTRLNSSH
jgi:hypothetical protein